MRTRVRALAIAASSATFFATQVAGAALSAFPGASGFGAGATGGRGGEVVIVSTLDPTGPGSLQEAMDQEGPRVVVFAVSGVIYGDIVITHGDVTIAGQTAPGGGITIAGGLYGKYDVAVSNLIIRHVRVRPMYSSGGGGQFLDSGQFSRNGNYILDHMSFAWGVDETLDAYEATNATIQFCTIEEGATEGHPEGEHNYGFISGPDSVNITVHHNFFVHQKNRNPAMAGGPSESINNVAYNVRHGFIHHNPASGPFRIIGNSFVRGNDDDLIPFYFDDENGFADPDLSYYLADNAIDDPGVFVGTVDNPWAEPFVHPSFEFLFAPSSLRTTDAPVFEGVTPEYIKPAIESAADAYEHVKSCAGAFPRDVVTRRVFTEFEERAGSWGIDVPSDLMEGLTPASPPEDTDADGMPDAWELANGLDSADGADHALVMASGYTAIEVYINELADELSCSEVIPPNPATGSTGASGANGPTETNVDGGCAMATTPDAAEGPTRSWSWAALAGLAVTVLRRRRGHD